MPSYERQDSPQTLAEALVEAHAANPGLADVRTMSGQAQRFFRSHDVVHVVFGCGTSLDDEAVVKIASTLGTALRCLRQRSRREAVR